MRIAMIGTGYGGLVLGTCFSDVGRHVVRADDDTSEVRVLHAGCRQRRGRPARMYHAIAPGRQR